MANIVRTVIQIRRAKTADWLANKDVIPAAGEPCFDLDLNTLKIGDGVKSYENLEPIGVKVELDADGKSIVLEDNVFKLMGFDAAEVGAQPRKSKDGNIEWVVPSTETVDGLKTAVAGLQSDVASLQKIVMPSEEGAGTLLDRVNALENSVGESTVSDQIDAKLNKFMTDVSDDKTVNTMKELIDYVAEHGPEAADMAADIKILQDLVGTTSVNDQILDIVNKSETKSKAIFECVKYEVTSKPAGAVARYRDDEIRVMCPADTQWTIQNSGENADPSMYYMGIKAYAPDDAVKFKEDTKDIIEDQTMYTFDGEFAGIDAYGRKYSIIWLPLAQHDAETDTWNYYGAGSTNGRYIGWYYSVEWYDANDKMIDSDKIRINLSNETCHNYIKPFYMDGYVNQIAVNGTLLDVINGKVNIAVKEYKASDEITIAEDGTLGIGTIGVSKLVNEDGTTLVLDGGGAAV